MTIALVLSAGGMFAAWEVGVWKALRNRFEFDMIVGTSAGAWNGWAIAGGCSPEDLASDWQDPLTAQIMQVGLHRRGILRPAALHRKARDLFARYQPRVPFGLTLTEVPRFRPILVTSGGISWEHLAATASIPLCFPPMTIAGRRYVDGGLLGALPLWAAEEMGATRVIAVNALTTLPFRMLRKVIRPRRPRGKLDVTLLEPSRPLGSLHNATFWNANNIAAWIQMGERDANQALLSITM